MSKNAVLLIVLLLLLILGVVQSAVYYPKLPDVMATHFNANGEANGTLGKSEHTAVMICLQFGMAAMFVVIGFAGKRLPASMINIPNKEYWLDPKRRDETMVRMNSGMYTIGIGTQLFMLAIGQMIIIHNLGQNGMFWFWPVFTIYMVFIAGFVIWITYQFRLPSSENAGQNEQAQNERRDLELSE